MPGYETYSFPPDSKSVNLRAQLAANKIQSVHKYLIWMFPSDDISYRDSAEILHKAFAELMQESLDQDLVAAFDYASKWEQMHYLEVERKYASNHKADEDLKISNQISNLEIGLAALKIT